MKKTSLFAALVLTPAVVLAQHGGHGGHGSSFGGHEERPAATPRRRDPPPPPRPPGPTQIYVLVDDAGFSPSEIPLKVGESAEIIVMRRSNATCAKEIMVPDLDVRLTLPLEESVRFAVKPTKAGRIHFTCGQGHLGGDIVVR